MTNPNDAIGTNAAYGGRTSVNAFNDVAAVLSRGVISGWKCIPDTGLKVKLGGEANVRDVAIAEDNAGNKTTINNRTKTSVEVTLPGAPGANSRIDAIVAYVDPTVQSSADSADNHTICGLVVASGTAASAPQMPDDTTIRAAITSDGANGTSAFYVVLASITMKTSMTNITASEIMQGNNSSIQRSNIENGAITSDKLADGSVTADKLGPKSVTSEKIDDNAVKADNVDWSTLVVVAPQTNVSSASAHTRTLIQQLTVPEDGKYKIEAFFKGTTSDIQTGAISTLTITKDGSDLQGVDFRNAKIGGEAIPICFFPHVADLKKGNIIRSYYEPDCQVNVSKVLCSLTITRIG